MCIIIYIDVHHVTLCVSKEVREEAGVSGSCGLPDILLTTELFLQHWRLFKQKQKSARNVDLNLLYNNHGRLAYQGYVGLRQWRSYPLPFFFFKSRSALFLTKIFVRIYHWSLLSVRFPFAGGCFLFLFFGLFKTGIFCSIGLSPELRDSSASAPWVPTMRYHDWPARFPL